MLVWVRRACASTGRNKKIYEWNQMAWMEEEEQQQQQQPKDVHVEETERERIFIVACVERLRETISLRVCNTKYFYFYL